MESEVKEEGGKLESASSHELSAERVQAEEQSSGPERALSEADARVAELEQALAWKETEIAGLKLATQGLEARAKDLDRSLAEAVAGYKGLVVQANPDVLPELVSGETIQAIEDSLKQAKAVVSRVKQGIEANLALGRFPTGAPERGGVGLDLSPREKIQQGISRRS